MVAFRLQAFAGMRPSVADRLIADNGAVYGENTWLYEGNLEGIISLREIHTLANPNYSKVFRVPLSRLERSNIPDSFWLEFPNIDTDIVVSPVAGDSFERFYFCAPNAGCTYNSRTRILNGDPALTLGVPAPSTAPGVSVSGGAAPTTARAYVYTWVTTFGEESAPSPPTLFTGNITGTWNLTFTAPSGAVTTGRLITHTNIYRTVTAANGSTTYFFVAQVPIATLAYADSNSDATVSLNAILASTAWTPPPDDLEGIIELPNGMIAGFRENEIWYAEPYRPHAWPASYQISVGAQIVGLGAINQSLVIMTDAHPYVATGINPANVQLSKLASIEPCASRGSIVQLPAGVIYASLNGLVLVSQGQVQNLTAKIMTRDRWLELMAVSQIRAARLNTAYYAFGAVRQGVFEPTAFQTTAFTQEDGTGARTGMLLDLTDDRIAYSTLSQDVPIINVFADQWTDEIFVVKGGKVYWLDTTYDASGRDVFKWRSKMFSTVAKDNLGVCKVFYDIPEGTPTQNPTATVGLTQTLQDGQHGLVRAFAGTSTSDFRHVWTREMRFSGEEMKLPSGFKADFWYFEIEARVVVTSFQVAGSAKELAGV